LQKILVLKIAAENVH